MKIVRCENLVHNLKDSKPCVVNTRKLKQALNRSWVIEKFMEWLDLINKFSQNHIIKWTLICEKWKERKKEKII